MLTPQHTREQIQNAIDLGGIVEFSPGIYEDASYRITAPVRIKGNGATLIGGKKAVWTKEANGMLSCDAPTGTTVRSIVVNNTLRKPCRYPEQGYLHHVTQFGVRWLSAAEGGWEREPTNEEMTKVRVNLADIEGLTLDSAEITVIHSWNESRVRIVSLEDDTLTIDDLAIYPAGSFGKDEYCLWNVPEALTEGTFYHDTVKGKLYYSPLPGESTDINAYIPTRKSIFFGESIDNVIIEDLTITCTEPDHVKQTQSISAALEFTELQNSEFKNIEIRSVGGSGICLRDDNGTSKISSCRINDAGAYGIFLIVKDNNPKSEITDCQIHGIGKVYASAAGIYTHNCNIRHNHVSNTSYCAVISLGKDYIIEKNVIHNAMEVLNDGAGIYTINSQHCIMRGNVVYGINTKPKHHLRAAYYLDEFSRNWLVENNIAIDCDFPNHNHMGGENTYRENIFINTQGSILIKMLRAKWKNRYIRNIFSAMDNIVILENEDDIECFEDNLFHSQNGIIIEKLISDEAETPHKFIMSESNKPIDAINADTSSRLFSINGIVIDARDAGPRSAHKA